MPRYSLYGRLDSRQSDDGDTSFLRINQRLRPDQLKSGEVAISQNGRMDQNGSWKTRKGYNSFGPAIVTGGGLVLPFNLNASPTLSDSSVNSIYGSCLYSDPRESNKEYILIATNTKALLINVATGVSIDIAYPNSQTIDATCEVIQAFHYAFIFRDGKYAFQWDGSGIAASPAFTAVSKGLYTQPVVYSAASNATIADGIVTITATAHSVVVGDIVIVSDIGDTDLNVLTEYRVYFKEVNTFKFKADASNVTAKTISVGKRQSIGLGFTHMPAPPWAIMHQRRLWMPFYYTMTGSSGTPTVTSRNIRDEIIASDILDQNTYDQIQNQYKINSGGSDFVVALQPFAEDNMIVFSRNSIHLITGVGADLVNSSVQELTREVGCIARKSIAQVGNQVMFLSDNGVYSVDFQYLYNLKGASVPLSAEIDPIMKRINTQYASNSVGIYHDNKYYLAIPIDNSIVNNALVIYSFINSGWESLDVIDDQDWNVMSLIRAGAGGFNRLFALNKNGGIHLIDDESSNLYVDKLRLKTGETNATIYPIDSQLKTREYVFETMDIKRFISYQVNIKSDVDSDSDCEFSIDVQDPDSTSNLKPLSELLEGVLSSDESAVIRSRIGNKRGYGIQMSITPTTGRPSVNGVKISAIVDNIGLTNAK